ncbi:MAG: hypothetical protein AAFP13_11620 [Pseudomonadota bacterium]
MSLRRAEVPRESLLAPYLSEPGTHVDAYVVSSGHSVDLSMYVEAMFCSPVFRLERAILQVFAGARSSAAQVAALASGEGSRMAVWTVEARTPSELLLTVPETPIRTWLAVEPGVLWFGSVVRAEQGRLPLLMRLSLPFHALYSRVLLWSAARRVSRRP